jgi:hypothetical protein
VYLPAENESFFDMFALNNRLEAMQRRIDMLEKRIEEIKVGK